MSIPEHVISNIEFLGPKFVHLVPYYWFNSKGQILVIFKVRGVEGTNEHDDVTIGDRPVNVYFKD